MEYTSCPYCKRLLTIQDFNHSTKCPKCGGNLSKWFIKTDFQIQLGASAICFILTAIYVVCNGGLEKVSIDVVKVGIGLGLGFLTGGILIKAVKVRLLNSGINIGRNTGLLLWNAIPVMFWCSSFGQSLIEKLIKSF